MQTLIKPSAAIRQNYTEIATLCKETGEPVFLTKNGEGDLVVMDIAAYDQREKQLELRRAVVPDISARSASANLRTAVKEKSYVHRRQAKLWYVSEINLQGYEP